MNTKKPAKPISTMLVLALVAVAILSCNGPEKSEGDAPRDMTGSDGATQNATEPEEVLPVFDFGGYEFVILNMIQSEHTYMNIIMETAEETGEPINDAAYRRSRELEEHFNITLRETNATSTQQAARKEILAGDTTFDLAMLIDRELMILSQQSMVARIDALPNVRLDKAWWDQNAKKAFSIGGKLFALPGAYQLSNLDLTRFVLFNKQLLADIDGGDLYKLVKDGTWTFDRLISIARQHSKDLNGDGVFDENDSYGLLSIAHHISSSIFFYGSGEAYIKKDGDDIPYFAMPGNERAVMIFQKVMNDLYEGNYYFCVQGMKGSPDLDAVATAIFAGDRALFYAISLNRIPKFRDMDSPFGILPPPKFEEAQEKYYCESGGGLLGMVPASADSEVLARAGAVWDAYSQLSYKYVLPAYFDVSLKTKFSRDPESEEMLDLIYKNLWYDLGNVYWWSDIINTYNGLFVKKDTNIVSATEKINDKINKIISDYVDSFMDVK